MRVAGVAFFQNMLVKSPFCLFSDILKLCAQVVKSSQKRRTVQALKLKLNFNYKITGQIFGQAESRKACSWLALHDICCSAFAVQDIFWVIAFPSPSSNAMIHPLAHFF